MVPISSGTTANLSFTTNTIIDTTSAVNSLFYVDTSLQGTTSAVTDFDSNIPYHTQTFNIRDVLCGNDVLLDFNTKLRFKDGSIIEVDATGNFIIIDKDAKVLYKGNNIREFNKYVNASDLLEDFINFIGQRYNVKQNQILQIPLELFINWLIIKASEQDGDGDDCNKERKILGAGIVKRYSARCRYCGRFISRTLFDAGIYFCNPEHYQLKLQAINPV